MKPLLLAAATLALAVPAAAQTPVAVPAFDSIELRGGGHVTIRHGARQRVTLVRGNTEMTQFRVDRNGQLTIQACVRRCRNYDLRIEIVTPEVDAAAIHGGGAIRTEGSFPGQSSLAVAINGGGAIDVRSVAARNVAASIRGGGVIRTDARDSLAASINGGGAITYLGNPTTTVSINGGGTVSRAR